MKNEILRGEIYLINFNPAIGHEVRDIHPALVIQNDIGNKYSAVTIVAAITSNLKVARLPVGILIDGKESGLKSRSVVNLGQIHTVDKERLGKCIGSIPAEKMKRVDRAIEVSLGLRKFWEPIPMSDIKD